MLKLFLDEHLSPELARQLRAHRPDIEVAALLEWSDGALVSADDATVLQTIREHGYTLLTYDLRTIPLLLREFLESGTDHAGVIFVDDSTIAQTDIGSLVKAVVALHDQCKDEDWTNRVDFLSKSS